MCIPRRLIVSLIMGGPAAAIALSAGCSASADSDKRSLHTERVRRVKQIEAARLRAAGGSASQDRRAAATIARGADSGSAESGYSGAQSEPLRLVSLADDAAVEQDWAAAANPDAASSEPVDERTARRRPPLPDFWDTLKRDVKYIPRDLWRDTKNVYGRPTNLLVLGAAYGGAVALQTTGPDDTVEDHYDRHNTFLRDWRDVFATAGNPILHFGLAGAWYLAGQQTSDDKTYEVGKTLFSALAINGVTVLFGQAAYADDAPNGQFGTFPSGHTSSAFCFASVMHEAYGPLVGAPLYGLSALVGVERLDSKEHYFSDVVFGAVMGTLIGHSVASGRDPEIFGWQVIPYVDPVDGKAGIGLTKSF